MDSCINKRVLEEGWCFAAENKSIREVARDFNVSKSTVHKDLRARLPLIDEDLALLVSKKLINNFINKHIKGGETTRLRYQRLK